MIWLPPQGTFGLVLRYCWVVIDCYWHLVHRSQANMAAEFPTELSLV